jgi:hypothetical protein
MVATALLTFALLAGSAIAVPARSERSLARQARRRQSKPINRVGNLITNTSHVEYSDNWSGAVYNSAAVRFYTRSFLAIFYLLL